MYYGNIQVTLRPIKFAFICHFNDKKSLLKAIEANSVLWGGIYNPIIPLYDKTPPIWVEDDFTFKFRSRDDYLHGILHNFDPDFVVPLGKYENEDFSKYNIKRLNYTELISANSINYGINIFSILSHFYEKELKFIRKDPIKIISPTWNNKSSLFLASVFGQSPKQFIKSYEAWEAASGSKKVLTFASNFLDLLDSKNMFIRRFSSLYINTYLKETFERTNIFYMDPSNALDIMDYWNLRAMGRNIIPLPLNSDISNENVQKHIKNQIDAGYGKSRYNPSIEYSTYFIKGRGIKESQFNEFIEKIKTFKSADSKITIMSSYPNLWQILRRHGMDYSAPELEVEKRYTIISGNRDIRVETLKPKFSKDEDYNNKAKYANEIELDFSNINNILMPQVLPHTNYLPKPLHALGVLGFDKARLSNKGIVSLDESIFEDINISIPSPADLFFSYLAELGVKAQKSKPGRITYKMLENIGGVSRLEVLAEPKLLELINKTVIGNGYIVGSELRNILKKIKGRNDSILSISAEGTIYRLLEANALELGLEIECPTCTRTSWFAANSLDKKLTCPKCLDSFSFPSFEPDKETKWAYRFIGPFSLKDYAQGSYSVLLTLHFFSEVLNLKTTPAFNFDVMKGNDQDYEIDLGFLTKDRLTMAKETIPVFCECKSFKHGIEKKDVINTLKICAKFPYSIAVFAVLKDSLTNKEKALLNQKVNNNYKLKAKGKPYTDIMILTSREIFTQQSIEDSWKKGTQLHKQYADKIHWFSLEELAEITRKVYLGSPDFHEWYDTNIKPKYQRKKDLQSN